MSSRAVAGGVALVSGGKMTAAGSSVVAAGMTGVSSSVGAWRSGEDVGAAALRGLVVGGAAGPADKLFRSARATGRLANAGAEGAIDSGMDSLLQGNSAGQILCDAGMGVVQSVATAGLLDAAGKPLTTRIGVTDPPGPNRGLVIGRVDDLQEPGALRSGERTLLPQMTENLGSPVANWRRNSSLLRQEMRNRILIRDASALKPDSFPVPIPEFPGRTVRQTFTGMERDLLRNRGWTFDGEFWNPPAL